MTALQDALQALASGASLSTDQAEAVATQLIAGDASPASVGAILMALRVKGETADELIGFVRAIRAAALPFDSGVSSAAPLLDTCGTGGDGLGTYNISTAVAIILAGMGIHVVKHGNRAASSRTGSADVLEALGYPLTLSANASAELLRATRFCFLMAPAYHPALRHVGPIRKELGVRTIFNFCGPLCNPAHPTHQILGVSDPRFLRPMAEVLAAMGVRGALVMRGHDGLDEMTLSSGTEGWIVGSDCSISEWQFEPGQIGWAYRDLKRCQAANVAESAAAVIEVLSGDPCDAADLATLNGAAALCLCDRARDLRDGIEQIRTALRTGQVWHQWELIIQEAKRLA